MANVVLLTDFGAKDYFVGVVKGVTTRINPLLNIIDLTNEIEPQNVRQAAFVLWAARKAFAKDTIFLNIVDPGVGGDRRIICGRIDGQIFLAPDNGLLDYVVAEAKEVEVYEVKNPRLFLPSVSPTFHGRDIFAPVAAYLSLGTKLNELGDRFDYPKVATFYKKIEKGGNVGEVVYLDRFGNVFTSFLWDNSLLSGKSSVKINARVITEFVRTYSAAKKKTPVCVEGSGGLIEIAVNLGNASKILKSKIGQKVFLTLK